MANTGKQQRKGGRTFTFVDYDINRRGVTELARAHLMKDRVRLKKEARSEWLSRNQSLPLRWMHSKQGNGDQEPDFATATAIPNRQDRVIRPSISGYTTVIDFRNDETSSSPSTGGSRPGSPHPEHGKRVDTSPNPGTRQPSPEQDSISRHTRQARTAPGDRRCVDMSRSPARASQDATEVERLTGVPGSKKKMDSEFGLSFPPKANTPPAQREDGQKTWSTPGTPAPSNLSVLPELETSCEKASHFSTPSDPHLIGYFAANAGAMLGIDQFPDIVQRYNPVLTLFIPFALSSPWCFETMVLLQSAYHHRQSARSVARDSTMWDAEDQYLASRQNGILARTRSRISALAVDGDSHDEDVIAFLFLAISEYRAGHRQLGLIHFQAWKEYCEMRRKLGVMPCGLPCKIVVWWSVAMLVGADVILDSILSPATMERVREDPAKLFRYFAQHHNVTSMAEAEAEAEPTEEPVRVKLSRHYTW